MRAVRPSSRRLRSLAASLAALLPLGAFVGPAAPVELATIVVPIPTTYVAPWNHAGGTGDVRASWRNDGAQIDEFGVTVEAPPGQIFPQTGLLTVYVLDPLTGVWNIGGQPRVEDECAVSADGGGMECAGLAAEVPQGSSLAVSFPTFVAPGAGVTGAASIEPGTIARLHVGTSSWDSFEATAVASNDPILQSSEFPTTGTRLVRGGANPGTIVRIVSASAEALGSTRADAEGRWAVLLPPGYGLIDAVFETLDGALSTSAAGYYNSYVFAIASPADGATWSATQTLSGSGQPGSDVVVRSSAGVELTSGRADASGTWTLILPGSLAPGDHELVVTNTISDGSSTSALLRGRLAATPPPTPEPTTSPTPGPTTSPTPTPTPTPAPATPRIVISVSPGDAVADGEAVRVVRVVVSESAGAPLAGEWVEFAAPDGLALSASTALTDVRGVATTTVAATQSIAARVTVRSVGTQTTTPVMRFVADPTAGR